MSKQLDIETLTRPGGIVPVNVETTAGLVREVLRLRKGIQDYLEGNYENARKHRHIDPQYRCEHGQHYWEDCEGCIDEHFSLLLGETGPLPNGDRQCP